MDHVKSTKEYQAYLASGDATIEDPDPVDRSIHKRDWEARVMTWRRNLKSYQSIATEGCKLSGLMESLLGIWHDNDGSFYWLTQNTKKFIDVFTVRPDGRSR